MDAIQNVFFWGKRWFLFKYVLNANKHSTHNANTNKSKTKKEQYT